MAADYASVRRYDRDGRLHVAAANISAARVNSYLGSEIPDAGAFGLQPGRPYRLWRHPAELARAAPSFNALPITLNHVITTADDHRPGDIIGATGSEAEFDTPFLRNSLVIWAAEPIRLIESGAQRELSCAYRYEPDMRPGVTPDGQAYDGVMRNIVGQHLALVPEGRAGPDVVIGDGRAPTPDYRDYLILFPASGLLRHV